MSDEKDVRPHLKLAEGPCARCAQTELPVFRVSDDRGKAFCPDCLVQTTIELTILLERTRGTEVRRYVQPN